MKALTDLVEQWRHEALNSRRYAGIPDLRGAAFGECAAQLEAALLAGADRHEKQLTDADLWSASTACEAQGNIHDRMQSDEEGLPTVQCTRGKQWHDLAVKIAGVAGADRPETEQKDQTVPFAGWPRAGLDHLGLLCHDPVCVPCGKIREARGRIMPTPRATPEDAQKLKVRTSDLRTSRSTPQDERDENEASAKAKS